MDDVAPRELSNGELIAWLQQFPADDVVSLDVRMLGTTLAEEGPLVRNVCHFALSHGIDDDGAGLVSWVKITAFAEPY